MSELLFTQLSMFVCPGKGKILETHEESVCLTSTKYLELPRLSRVICKALIVGISSIFISEQLLCSFLVG